MDTSKLCCCCLTDNCYKNVFNEYYYGGSKESFYQLIFTTLNIKISERSPLICESCASGARTLAQFRECVVRAQTAILGTSLANDEFPEPTTEIINDDFKDHIVGDFVDSDQSETGWNDKLGIDDDEELEPDEGYREKRLHKKSDMEKKKSRLLRKRKLCQKFPKYEVPVPQASQKVTESQSAKAKQDSLTLIINSNMCLFESLKTKFRCFYCKDSFLHAKELREHSSKHSDESYLRLCFNRLQGKSFKNVEISDLKCKICSVQIDDLNNLREHLTVNHEIEFKTEKDLLIPYRLENCECVICRQKFNTFFKLSIHMNSHFANHVCETCGVAYINRISLRTHIMAMHTEIKCKLCSMTLHNVNAKVKHMRSVHNKTSSKRYCLLCNQTFRYAYLLDEHKIKTHGMKRNVSECEHCGKVFFTAQNLRIHVRSVHIKERNYGCGFCDMRFFTKCDQLRHESTHLDIRSFSCNFCDGTFKSKDSLRRHCRRQHDLATDQPATETT